MEEDEVGAPCRWTEEDEVGAPRRWTEEEAGATGAVTGGSLARGPNSARGRRSRCASSCVVYTILTSLLASCSRMESRGPRKVAAHGRGAPREAVAHWRDAAAGEMRRTGGMRLGDLGNLDLGTWRIWAWRWPKQNRTTRLWGLCLL
jgi:hypothetical protein